MTLAPTSARRSSPAFDLFNQSKETIRAQSALEHFRARLSKAADRTSKTNQWLTLSDAGISSFSLLLLLFVVARLSHFFPRRRSIEKLPEFIVHVAIQFICHWMSRRVHVCATDAIQWKQDRDVRTKKRTSSHTFFVRMKAFAFWCLSLFSPSLFLPAEEERSTDFSFVSFFFQDEGEEREKRTLSSECVRSCAYTSRR